MKIIRYFLLLILGVTFVYAQPRQGSNRDLSISGSYQNYSSGNSSGNSSAFFISPRFGIYVVEGLEIEPEFSLVAPSSGDPAYMLNGNIAYNFLSAGRGVPFLLIGYGIANTVPVFNIPFSRSDFRVDVLNLGVGVKGYVKEDIAIRVEYRYQSFSGKGPTHNYGFGSYTEEVDARSHTVQFGLSILL